MITVTDRELAHAAVAATNVKRRHCDMAGRLLMRSLASRHPSHCQRLAEDEAREAYAAELEARDLDQESLRVMDSRRHSAEVPA